MKKTESRIQKKARVAEVIRLFQRYNPHPKCALNHSSPEELLIATILSAQCTDERVNIVTGPLFKKYKSMASFAAADLKELENDIRSTGFYKNKAKNIVSCAKTICEKYGGRVPKEIESLVTLAGVGRKTANVVLGNSFGIASGVVVDTHVTRLSHRLDFSRANSAEKIEEDLNQLVDQSHWINFSHWLILHGRAVCKARKPQCEVCYLQELCPKRL
jgi:endonuclease-3